MKSSTLYRLLFALLLILFTLTAASCLDLAPLPDEPTVPEPSEDDPPAEVTVRFFKDGKALGSGQTVKSGNRVLAPDYALSDDGQYSYTVIGWDADGDGNPETFPYTVTKNTDFHLLYTKTEKKYDVEIYDRGTLLSAASYSYGQKIGYPDLNAFIDGDTAYLPLGWAYDGVFDGYYYPYVTRSVRIDAVYAENAQVLKLYFGSYLYSIIKEAGDSLDFGGDFGVSAGEGKVIRYYTDDTYTTPLTLTFMPENNLTLYAREESADASLPTVHVGSREELLGIFSRNLINRETAMEFALDYDENAPEGLLSYLKDNSETYTAYTVSSSLSAGILKLDLTYGESATKTSETVYYRQIASLNADGKAGGRSAVFDDFASDKRENGFPVKNSDALYHALENGYRPDIDPDATDVIALYNTMKIFLREAVSDDMTDFEKVRAIYEKLILETVYDKAVLTLVENGEEGLTAYRAFALEGVFIDKLAVCDGISKAFASLCAMEGIACIRVSGTTVDGKTPHAWNKVKLGEKWYVVDATAGGTIVESVEVLTYAYFLRSDAAYAAHATENENACDVRAEEEYGFYDSLTVRIGDTDFALDVISAEQGGALLRAVIENYPLFECSVDLRLSFGTSTEEAVRALMNAAGIFVSLHYAESLGSVILIFQS